MNAEMHIENGKMIYGTGTRPMKIACRTCKGKGLDKK